MALLEELELFFTRGINIDENIALVSGNQPPEVAFPDHPVGTFYFRNNGSIYRKLQDSGSGVALDWEEGGGGSGSLLQQLPFFLESGVQQNIPLSLGGLPFCLSDGTNTSIPIV